VRFGQFEFVLKKHGFTGCGKTQVLILLWRRAASAAP